MLNISYSKLPALVWNGFQTKETDMCTTHEEADIIIIQQCYASADEVPAVVWNGIQTKEIDMRTTHEEGDIIIIQRCYEAVSNGYSYVKVISDDMDVSLVFLYLQQNCNVPIFIESNHGSRTVVDIAATTNKWPQIIPMLPVIHVLTGPDSTSRTFEIGIKTALNICANKSLM